MIIKACGTTSLLLKELDNGILRLYELKLFSSLII